MASSVYLFFALSVGLLTQTFAYVLVGSPMEGDAHTAQKFGQTVAYRNNKMRMYQGWKMSEKWLDRCFDHMYLQVD